MKYSKNRKLGVHVVIYFSSFFCSLARSLTISLSQPLASFSFGRELHSLPQCFIPTLGGDVPQFLVDACEFLSLHLHTEGLFRKSGSVSRIRALQSRLEQGESVLSSSSAPQPCDVAALLKQFFRELPSPLLPLSLQAPLCRAQGLPDQNQRQDATLLLTALLPAARALALRYLCTFLRRVADRVSDNRMSSGSLALVFSPNLFQCPGTEGRFTAGTERLLERQTGVLRTLIGDPERIGTVPSSILDTTSQSPSRAEPGCATPSDEVMEESEDTRVDSATKRRRRRSVGEIFADALGKLKTTRTPTNIPIQLDRKSAQQGAVSLSVHTSFTAKRKAPEEAVPGPESPAKKRRSVQDSSHDPKILCLSPTAALLAPEGPCDVVPGSPGSYLERTGAPPPRRTTPQSSTKTKNKTRRRRSTRTDLKQTQRLASGRASFLTPVKVERSTGLRKSLRLFTLGQRGSRDLSALGSLSFEAGSWTLGRKRVIDSPGGPAHFEGEELASGPAHLADTTGSELEVAEIDPHIPTSSFQRSPVEPSSPDTSLTVQVDTPLQPEGREREEERKEEEKREKDREKIEREERDRNWLSFSLFRSGRRGKKAPRRSLSLPEGIAELGGKQAEEGEGEEEQERVMEETGEVEEKREESSIFRMVMQDAWPPRRKDEKEEEEKEKEEEEEGDRPVKMVVPELVAPPAGGEEEREEEEKRMDCSSVSAPVEDDEGGRDFKKVSQVSSDPDSSRLSVTDRIRCFNKLSSRLWSPWPGSSSNVAASGARPPLHFQRSPVLRVAERFGGTGVGSVVKRKGARRFGRSLSHESVMRILEAQKKEGEMDGDEEEEKVLQAHSQPQNSITNLASSAVSPPATQTPVKGPQRSPSSESSPHADLSLESGVAGGEEVIQGVPEIPSSLIEKRVT
ncbi:rho GTPase-activating protein 11A-like [Polyodon spathula]|uniref:rho GTPase-activating protein 11A-like n=1 Tax=Polyodon spathula TaxID=7913 RepID=UPI001B7F4C00|nr:rho GTPase-activating protein 11A-like [Polyodon spathula]